MVVGDIFRNELNHKDVIKEIILLGLDFIREIKNIKAPGDIVLSIRLGINIGTVNIGKRFSLSVHFYELRYIL
jgi:hypothetical protein